MRRAANLIIVIASGNHSTRMDLCKAHSYAAFFGYFLVRTQESNTCVYQFAKLQFIALPIAKITVAKSEQMCYHKS